MVVMFLNSVAVSMLGKNFNGGHSEIFFQENRFWHFMPKETICMKCQSPFFIEKKN